MGRPGPSQPGLLLGPLPIPLPPPALTPGLAASLHHSQLEKSWGDPIEVQPPSVSGNSHKPLGVWGALCPPGLSFSQEDGPRTKRNP